MENGSKGRYFTITVAILTEIQHRNIEHNPVLSQLVLAKRQKPGLISGSTFTRRKAMTTLRKTILVTLSSMSILSLAAGFSAPALAQGVIGGFIEGLCGGCGVGRTLDDVHRQLGNPLDRAAAGAAQSLGVPLSPYCATQWGVAVGPWAPIGADCYDVNGSPGVIVQR
jgi:hypothetical protein